MIDDGSRAGKLSNNNSFCTILHSLCSAYPYNYVNSLARIKRMKEMSIIHDDHNVKLKHEIDSLCGWIMTIFIKYVKS